MSEIETEEYTTQKESKRMALVTQDMSRQNVDISKLNGTNYLNWRSLMNDLLELRGLVAVTNQELEDTQLNLQAKILIKGSLDEKNLAEVINFSSAHEIWSHLSRLCLGTNSRDVALLVRKF